MGIMTESIGNTRKLNSSKLILMGILLFIFAITSCVHQQKTYNIASDQLSQPTTALLQAISLVDENVAWVSGHQATFCRTLDAGATWQVFHHPSDTLQFRDLHAFDANNLLLMSAGPGASSMIFLFHADSLKWTEAYVMSHPKGFLNSIALWDDGSNGLAFGDSFEGELFVLKTMDAGRSWKRIDPANLPPAQKGEGGFAASGNCITTIAGGTALIGTGAGGSARILKTTDYGESWQWYESPMMKGEAAGIFSIRMINAQIGAIVGGDLKLPDTVSQNVAWTNDGGEHWELLTAPITKGAFFGSAMLGNEAGFLLVAAGPSGIDFYQSKEKKWTNLNDGKYWAVELDDAGYGYAVGTEGKILRLDCK
jgi:photosystem II stability/assembly factor-like uncharacterized protein